MASSPDTARGAGESESSGNTDTSYRQCDRHGMNKRDRRYQKPGQS
jgi:hypothetical protein